MVNFIIPGFYENFDLNIKLVQLLKLHPEWFRDNIAIEAIYGVFPFNIFDGGRIFSSYRHATLEEIQIIKYVINETYGISLRQVCTNPQLEEKNFHNRFANICLSICEDEKNEIIINNDNLKEYIKINYPKYSFISSTTKRLSTIDRFQDELANDDYKIICLDYDINHAWKMLEELSQEEKDKCEFLCNAICPPGCTERKKHYYYNGQFALNFGENYHMSECGITDSTVSNIVRNYNNNITPDELYNKYAPMGFSHFKLEGRTLPTIEVALNYAYYMAKPEYHDEVVHQLTVSLHDFGNKMFNQVFKYI